MEDYTGLDKYLDNINEEYINEGLFLIRPKEGGRSKKFFDPKNIVAVVKAKNHNDAWQKFVSDDNRVKKLGAHPANVDQHFEVPNLFYNIKPPEIKKRIARMEVEIAALKNIIQ